MSASGSALRRMGRLVAAAVVIVAVALGGTLALQWWQEAPLRKARRELAAGDARRALAWADYFLDAHPDHGDASALRARALFELGDAKAATELYERVGAAAPDDMHAWAKAYLVQESWSRGVQFLKQYLRMRPDDADALYELAMSQARIGLFDDALEAAEKYTACPGEEASGLLLQAILRHDMKDDDAALEAFRRVVELVPDAGGLQLPADEIFLQYGNLLLAKGDAEGALEWLEKSLAIRPSGAALYNLGRARSQAGDEAAAARAWQKAVEIDPRGVSPREALAELALTAGRVDEAAEWLGPLETVAAERPETAYLFQRVAAARHDTAAFERWKATAETLRSRQQRVVAFENLMASAPGSPWAIALRAHRFASAGNWREAADLITAVAATYDDEPFIRALRTAIADRTALPSLDGVPLEAH